MSDTKPTPSQIEADTLRMIARQIIDFAPKRYTMEFSNWALRLHKTADFIETVEPAAPERNFSEQLASLCSREAIAAKHDPRRLAEMIERLTYSLGFTVSIAADTPQKAQPLIAGIEAHLYECATGSAKVINQARGRA